MTGNEESTQRKWREKRGALSAVVSHNPRKCGKSETKHVSTLEGKISEWWETETPTASSTSLSCAALLPEFLVHDLNVPGKLGLQLRPFGFEGGREESRFHRPRLRAQFEILDEFERLQPRRTT